jgi:hypothetical protein
MEASYLEYLHRGPASRRRRRKGNPVPGDITEVKTGSNLAELSKESCGSKCAVFPVVMMMIVSRGSKSRLP